jgi:hypothetical protein
MKPSNFKGALLEYLVRKLLWNCGFNSVTADGLYTFENKGLFFVNGKGAAHDADVLMEPPMQIPFTYPTRILFECKAYADKVGLPEVRNCLGLRHDINEFEIVTEATILKRQKNRRAEIAIKERKRYNYQIGLAGLSNFSVDAIEFAANNKIPLLSLYRFLSQRGLSTFHSIDQAYLNSINTDMQEKIYQFLKDRRPDEDHHDRHSEAYHYLWHNPDLRHIVFNFWSTAEEFYVGLIETGDLIFLRASSQKDSENFHNIQQFTDLRAQLHYYGEEPHIWRLSIFTPANPALKSTFTFFVPDTIMKLWELYSLDRTKAIAIKAEFFSRIYIFAHGRYPTTPVFTVQLDRQWMEEIRRKRIQRSD